MTGKRILVVEDQPITAMDECNILRDLGYQVTGIALSGEDAVRQADRDRPDLILMDINLAGPMSGWKAADKIRQGRQIPVVYVTAYGDKEKSRPGTLSMPEGVGYIVKPYTKNELESEVKRLLG
ncbi:MAG: response regulator [Rhodospirillales bacterium]